MLIHQLPPKPSYLRVKVWRRLQALGSVPIKNSVYALPNTDEAREDFEWMIRHIQDEGGEASLCEARLIEGIMDEGVQMLFVMRGRRTTGASPPTSAASAMKPSRPASAT